MGYASFEIYEFGITTEGQIITPEPGRIEVSKTKLGKLIERAHILQDNLSEEDILYVRHNKERSTLCISGRSEYLSKIFRQADIPHDFRVPRFIESDNSLGALIEAIEKK